MQSGHLGYSEHVPCHLWECEAVCYLLAPMGFCVKGLEVGPSSADSVMWRVHCLITFEFLQAAFAAGKRKPMLALIVELFCGEGRLITPEDCEAALSACGRDPLEAVDKLGVLTSEVCCPLQLFLI
jgi:hypothetical protein